MGDLKRVRAALGAAIVSLLVVALAPPGASAGEPEAWLKVSPDVYVAGQAMTFEGNIGRVGVQRIRVQTISDRPGDTWTEPEGGFHRWTDRDGTFKFTHPAPSMFGLRVRVATDGAATPGQPVTARSQDLALTIVPATPGLDPGQVRAGEPFAIEVDTAPTFRNRSDLPGPAFKGRTLTLQERVRGTRWRTLDTTTTDAEGQGRFERTVGEPGTVVYRVRQEDLTTNRHEIGWFPSFPRYVEVLPPTGLPTTTPPGTAPPSTGVTEELMLAPLVDTTATASKTHRWGRALWDFAWAFGESLTSPPYRGSDLHGWWLDASDGSGRAIPHNGQLTLESKRRPRGPGDLGTTAATLRGNPMRYGRWEAKIRLRSTETRASDYRVRIELVPDRPRDDSCGVITVADVAAHEETVTVGATAMRGTRQWTHRKRIGSLNGPPASFAVEVTRRHISWFVNGRVIATLHGAHAVPDVPKTMRLRMVGDGENEMNRTQVLSDWQRAFSLTRGRQITSGHGLQRGTNPGC